MSLKSFIAFAIVSYVFLPICKIDGTPVKILNSITQNIKNDTAICATSSVFVDSPFAMSCETINYPKETLTLSDENTDQFLCLGLYDRISRVCYLSSTSSLKALPHTATIFDSAVNQSFLQTPMDILQFCSNWKNIPKLPKYRKIASYVTQLDETLEKLPGCIKMCANIKGELKPLCAVLASIDKLSENTSLRSDPELKSHEGNSKAKENNVPGEKNVGQAKDRVSIEKLKEIVRKKKPEVSKNKTVEVNSKPKENNEANIVPSADGSQSLQNNHAPGENISAPQAKKPTIEQDAALRQQKAKNEKVADSKADNEKASVDVATNAADRKSNSGSAKNSQINRPLTGVDQASPIHDKSEEEPDQIPPLENEHIDETTDDIAERTEDNDRLTGGGEPSEDANELEPPIMPAVNDDVNESHAKTSEKHGYVPRIPGIPNEDDSHFFGYFTVIGVICIAGYVGYHNKQKILAMVLEGRRSRGGRGRRRPSTANYRKLDCTLEEAVTSQCNSNVTHVIY